MAWGARGKVLPTVRCLNVTCGHTNNTSDRGEAAMPQSNAPPPHNPRGMMRRLSSQAAVVKMSMKTRRQTTDEMPQNPVWHLSHSSDEMEPVSQVIKRKVTAVAFTNANPCRWFCSQILLRWRPPRAAVVYLDVLKCRRNSVKLPKLPLHTASISPPTSLLATKTTNPAN